MARARHGGARRERRAARYDMASAEAYGRKRSAYRKYRANMGAARWHMDAAAHGRVSVTERSGVIWQASASRCAQAGAGVASSISITARTSGGRHQ